MERDMKKLIRKENKIKSFFQIDQLNTINTM